MSRLPDLVRLSKLDTKISQDHRYTRHTYRRSELGQQPVKTQERWKREPRCIGRGGFGQVYVEKCVYSDDKTREGNRRAVKVLPKSSERDEKHHERELEAVAFASHPQHRHCFVESFGWFDTAEDIMITMEYLPEGDLRGYLSMKYSIPEPETKVIVSQVLKALQHMHEYGFAHRDLKPENILIARIGPEWLVKVADFGLTKRSLEDLATSTSHGGTFAFMAPEVLWPSQKPAPEGRLHNRYVKAVDIWAVGVISYHILTGAYPFAGFPTDDLKNYMVGKHTLRLEQLAAKGATDTAQDFVKRLLAAQPQHRPSTAECSHLEWIRDIAEQTTLLSTALLTLTIEDNIDLRSQASAAWEDEVEEAIPKCREVKISEDVVTVRRISNPDQVYSKDDLDFKLPGSGLTARRSTPEPSDRDDELDSHTGVNSILHCPASQHAAEQDRYAGCAYGHDIGSATAKLDFRGSWTLDTKHRIYTTKYGSWGDIRAACSPNGSFILVVVPSSRIWIWDTAQRKEVATISLTVQAEFILWSPDSSLVAIASHSCHVTVLHVTPTPEVSVDVEHQISPSGDVGFGAIAFSLDGTLLAIGTKQGEITIFKIETMVPIQRGSCHPSRLDPFVDFRKSLVSSMAFSPDGRYLASGDKRHGRVRLWNLETMDSIAVFDHHGKEGGYVQGLVFSTNCKRLASVGKGSVRLWDVEKRKPLSSCQLSTERRKIVKFTPDGLLAFTNHGNLTLRDPSKLSKDIATLDIKSRCVDSLEMVGDGTLTVVVWTPLGHYQQIWRREDRLRTATEGG